MPRSRVGLDDDDDEEEEEAAEEEVMRRQEEGEEYLYNKPSISRCYERRRIGWKGGIRRRVTEWWHARRT